MMRQSDAFHDGTVHQQARARDRLAVARLVRLRHMIEAAEAVLVVGMEESLSGPNNHAALLNQFAAGIEQACADRADLGIGH